MIGININFTFTLNKEIPTGAEYSAFKHGYIEGRLEIIVDENLFFQDEYICLAEFGIELGKWLTKIRSGLREEMHYKPIDHDEVIIDFLYKGNDKWKLFSIWQKFESNEVILTSLLVNEVERFLYELNKSLLEINYMVTLDEFI